MPPRPCRLILTVLVGLGGLAGALHAAAAETPATVVAVKVRGTVEVLHDQATAAEAVEEGAQLGPADTITTAAQSSVMLVLPNGSVVALKEKSRLKIAVALYSPAAAEALAANEAEAKETGVSQTGFELAFGQMLTRVRKLNPTSTFTVQTPVSVAAVRGTVFEVSYQTDAKGEAHYNLSTSSGLVHVTPHTGKMVAVAGNQQLDFAAELGKGGVKIKNLKAGKLAKQKQQEIDQEAADNDHAANDFMQRAKAAKAKAAAQASGNAPGAGAAPDKPAPGAGQTGTPQSNANANADRTAGPATPATKSATPATGAAPATNTSATPAAKIATPAANSTPAAANSTAATNRTTAPAATPATPTAKPATPATTVAKPATPAPTVTKPATPTPTVTKPKLPVIPKRPPRRPGG